MLFRDVPYGYVSSVAVANGVAEHALGLKDPERVMPKGAMPKIAKSLLPGVEPVVHANIVLHLSAKATHGGLRMKEWVSHSPSYSVVS